MQNPTSNAGSSLPTHKPQVSASAFLLLGALSMCLLATRAQAQAPGLLWTTNIGARVFAVDAQTNVYANAGSTVITVSPSGVPFQTNTICPVAASYAQRDLAGNFYFAGTFDGTQDFGGITLVGGWINNINFSPPRWVAGYPTCFLAKYASNGDLQWAKSFGDEGFRNAVSDLLLDSDIACYVAGYLLPNGSYRLSRFDNSGTSLWDMKIGGPFDTFDGIKLGGLTSSNCCFFLFHSSSGNQTGYGTGGRISSSGNPSFFGSPIDLFYSGLTITNGKPVIDDLGQVFLPGICNPCGGTQVLRKYDLNGAEILSTQIAAGQQWTLARGAEDSVYLAGTNGVLYNYDSEANLIWSTNLVNPVVSMLLSQGTRFISSQNGAVARLGDVPPAQPPSILIGPQPATVFAGDNIQLSASAGGTPTLRYFWRLHGTNVSGATSSTFTRSNATPAQAGPYTVVVTNAAGSITSAPALVRVKSVQLYLGSEMLTNGMYMFATPPTLSIHSAFTNGSSFYTLDGSTPGFASASYSGPFTLSQSATVRAIGYSADFFQSEEADAINAVVLVNHTLSATASAGGSVSLNPPGGAYTSTNVVTATAVPVAGWSFLYWLGDVSGTSTSVNVSMERDKHIQAVFGTTLSTTVAGNGSIQLSPPGGFYPIDTIVRLTAVPQPGNYFGIWGNAASGNTNPLYFMITSPTQTVSSIFGATPADQASLSVLINGHGRVSVNPRANAYLTNQTATLTALPDTGESFLNWSGDASGSQNPLTVSMTQSKVITANFTSRPFLRANRTGLEGFTPEGFRLTLVSDPQSAYQILASTNLSTWIGLGTVTNFYGEVQFTDTNAFNFRSRFYKAAP